VLDFLETFEAPAVSDWHRIGLSDSGGWFNVESGHHFAEESVARELADVALVWSRLNGSTLAGTELVAHLNDRPAASPAHTLEGRPVVTILDWAAFHQRHLCQAMVATSRHFSNLGATRAQKALVPTYDAQFSRLTLYPIVLRSVATTPADYERAMAEARSLVAAKPQMVTVAAWNLLAERPGYLQRAGAFPFVASWFVPAVPTGTAFDLHARALLPGCPRPPTRAQAMAWAAAAPFDHWTVWSAEWLAVAGKPSVAVVARAFGPLAEYDYVAILKMVEYLDMKMSEQLALAEKICTIRPGRCDVLANLLLSDARDAQAVVAYERWIANSRDRVGVSSGVTWLVRHYEASGDRARAETLARMVADTGSAGGLETLGHLLDARGHYADAQQIFQRIADRYENTVPLGTFFVRQGLRTADRALELKGWDNLRAVFPNGMERLELHALDPTPLDGMGFLSVGRRASATGLRATDIVVGVDTWRVRNNRQYIALMRMSHDPALTMTVWRDGRYQQLRLRVPERWLAAVLRDYVG
jgi:hypothetical protein